MSGQMQRVRAEAMRVFISRVFQSIGLPSPDADTVAGLMTEADLLGADGHGIFRLAQYVRRIQAGGVNMRPDIRIVRERAGMALVDGDNGMGHLVMKFAAETAVRKAKEAGVAWVGARMSNHAGPASLYARIPMRADMIGLYLAVGNANHLPPWGGVEMLLSTNPIAVAIPAGREVPVVLDMATTVAAYGKVKTKAQRGETMPEGWMIDRRGRPLTDPRRAAEGFLLPIGGYKGYGLALVFGLLAGTLNGAAMGREVVDFNADDSSVTNTGHAILALDILAFDDVDAFKQRIDEQVRTLRESERMEGVDRIWLPGEQSAEKSAERRQKGIPLSAPLLESLDVLAARLGVARLER